MIARGTDADAMEKTCVQAVSDCYL